MNLCTMKLHEAIEQVLKEANRGMTPREIAEYINKKKLYSRSDREKIPASQISARINKYQNWFQRSDDGLVYRVNVLQNDVISLAYDMQKKARDLYAHIGSFNRQIETFIPFIFFFKRVIDRKELIDSFAIEKTDFQFNLNGLHDFAQYLDSKSKLFSKKLDYLQQLIDDILKSESHYGFDEEIEKLSSFDFSNISDKEFGEVFSKILANTSFLNIQRNQYFTPTELSELIGGIVQQNMSSVAVMYNPGAGQASIPTNISRNVSLDFHFCGEEINQDAFLLGLMNLISNGVKIKEFRSEDSLLEDNKEFADIVVSDPPYTGRIQTAEIIDKYPVRTHNVVLLFIQRAIKTLKRGGIATIIVPEGVLFNNGRQYKALRKYLIENRLIESVISLPSGILQPISGVKLSLLVLSKKDNKDVLILDADSDRFFQKGKFNIKLNTSKILEIYRRNDSDNIVKEPDSFYGGKDYNQIKCEQFKEEDFDLSVKRYLIDEIKEPEGDYQVVKLDDILKVYRGRTEEYSDIPFVRISELNDSLVNFYLKEEDLKKDNEVRKGIFLDKPALLIGSITPNMKPTFFKAEKSEIVVSKSVLVFSIKEFKEEVVNIEYLMYELQNDYVQNQFKNFGRGVTGLSRISATDFLKIKIKLPSIEEQDRIVQLKKETVYASKLSEAEKYAKESGVTKIEEKKLLGFIKHEVGNIIPGISTDVNNLQSFFSKRIDQNEKISDRKNAPSVSEVFSRIQSNVKDVEDLLENINSIIRVGDQDLKIQKVKFKKFIREEVDKHSALLNENEIKVLIGVDQDYSRKKDKDIFIDTHQFSYLLRNFLLNTVKHAYNDINGDRFIVINMDIDEDFYNLSLINNGKPLPDGFILDDFLSFGGRNDNQKGSGLGGYLIGKVVENHDGTIDLMEPGSTLHLNTSEKDSELISDNFIRVGVHFYIKLPKKQ